MGLIERYKAWRERRYWQARHMDFVRCMVNDDWRWLGANPIADELTTRYRAALSPDWYQRQIEPVDRFRERLCKQLGPNTFSLGAPGNAGMHTPVEAPDADSDIARLMAAPEAEVDAELRALGMDPADAERRGRNAVQKALAIFHITRAEACLLAGEPVLPHLKAAREALRNRHVSSAPNGVQEKRNG